MKELANLTPVGGKPGLYVEDEQHNGLPGLLNANVFRHDLPLPVSSQDVWPQLLLWASYVFLCDIIVRRVRFSFDWLTALTRRTQPFSSA